MKTFRCTALFWAATSFAAQPQFFALDTPASWGGARAQGVAVRGDGALVALPPLAELASFQEPFAWAAAVAGGQLFVGTGHPARVYRVDQAGKKLLAELPADQTTALLLTPKGELYATTASPALLLRLSPSGETTTVAQLPQGNLWDMVWFRGELYLAAGNPGRLLRLTPRGLELAAAVPDRHARTLAATEKALFVGTSGKGLLLRFDGTQLGVLYDSSFTEITALAPLPEGGVVACALMGDPTLGQPPKGGETAITVATGGDAPKGTSEVLQVTAEGAVLSLHRFDKEIASAVSWGAQGVVVGTGLEGGLFQLVEGRASQLDSVDAAQVTRLLAGGEVVLTQAPVKLLRRQGPPGGSLLSPVLDAGQPARWGNALLRGQGRCVVAFRSGNTKDVGETWSSWSSGVGCGETPIAAPQARYLQVKVELGPGEARVEQVRLAYRQFNLPPVFKAVTVHPPGEVFLKSPPPSERIVEVTHPTLFGIFSTLEEEDRERQASLGKKYYRVGYQTVSWKAEDANGDPLRFAVDIQRPGGDFWPVRRDLESVQLALDTQALPDGLYRFRLWASDHLANPGEALTVSALSSWFVVDNAPPRITLHLAGQRAEVEAEDELSPILLAEAACDAQGWQPLAPQDGVLDSRRERFSWALPTGCRVWAVRIADDHHNVRVEAREVP